MNEVDSTPGGAPLDRVRIVLASPSHPGNIGAAARALKVMGLRRLVLVRPERFPDREADARAAHARDLLARAHVCASLEEALSGAALAYALTARPRDLSHAPLDPRSACAEAVAAASGDRAEIAFVFGNETLGLSNEEVLACNRLVHIPSDPEHGSLNLAAAVQVMCWELRMAAFSGRPPAARAAREAGALASLDEIEGLFRHWEQSVYRSGFLDPAEPKRLMGRIRRLFGRTGLERQEVAILRGMLRAWDEGGPKRGLGRGAAAAADPVRADAASSSRDQS